MLFLIVISILLNLLLIAMLMIGYRRIRDMRRQLADYSAIQASSRDQHEQLQQLLKRFQELQIQLLHERQQAAQEQQSRNLFLASISHEIRTPMSGLQGILTLLDKTALTDEQQDYVRTLQHSSEHLLAIVSDILDLSRIDANRLEIVEESFSLPELCRQLLALVRPKAAEKQLDLKLQTDSRIPELLLGDPVRIRQILMNFLTNAIKFTERGHILLQVDVLRQDDARVLLRLLVEDTGIGIAAGQAHKLFDEFSFAHGSLSERAGGTGLGLSICRRLAALMQGRVGVVSTPGCGSRFWLELPLTPVTGEALVEAPAIHHAQADGLVPKGPDYSGLEGLRILLAEDNPVNQKIARQMLQQMGCVVTVAGDGAEALRYYRSQEFDAILMDCHMPVMDGLEATRQLRELSKQPVPVIALSADVTSEQRKACIAAGMTAFLSKPVRQEALWQVLQPCQKVQTGR